MRNVYLRTATCEVSHEYSIIVSDGTNPVHVRAHDRSALCSRVHTVLGLPNNQPVVFTKEDVIRAGCEHYTVHHCLVANVL
jgi:hypothetical protein